MCSVLENKTLFLMSFGWHALSDRTYSLSCPAVALMGIRQKPLSFLVGLKFRLLLHEYSPLNEDKHCQGSSYQYPGSAHRGINGSGVIMQRPVSEGVEPRLKEVCHSREANERPIDAPECSEAENFSGVVAGMPCQKV